jgi:hypothetical protein
MRRKLTVIEQAIKDAAKELNLPKDHWDVERLATMQVMLKVARHKWSQGQSASAAGDMLTLMDSITTLRKEAKLAEPMDIKLQIVKRAIGIANITCKHCGKTDRYDLPDSPESRPQTPSQNKDPAPADVRTNSAESAENFRATPAAPAEVRRDDAESAQKLRTATPTMKVTRPGLSPSRFHDQQLPSGEIPPLKRLQAPHYPIRSVSPLSNGRG